MLVSTSQIIELYPVAVPVLLAPTLLSATPLTYRLPAVILLFLSMTYPLVPFLFSAFLNLRLFISHMLLALIGLFNSLFLFPWLAGRQATYGVLGVAAGLLFSFFLFGRTAELAAALNAELSENRSRRRLAR